jgi:uncharacterized protein YdcH (DUF465 family)
MSDFVESAKNFVNSAVSRTSWEAQKQMRMRGKQGEIDKLMQQRQQLLDELVQAAMSVYQQGGLSDSHLSRLCASVLELDHDVKTRDTQLQDIKSESYQMDQPGPITNYAPPPTPQPTASTSTVGASTGTAGGASAAGTQAQLCPNCKQPLRSNALYCRSCGAKVR